MTYNHYCCTPVRNTAAEHPGQKFWWKLDLRGRCAGENQAVKYFVRNRDSVPACSYEEQVRT